MTTLSYVHGASDVPLIGYTIGAYLDMIVAKYGTNDALVSRGGLVCLNSAARFDKWNRAAVR